MHIDLPSFAKARVLVAGDAMLDRYWSGPVTRISPEAPVPVLRVSSDETRPGGAANVALNVAGLGAQAQLMAVTGDDAPGRLLAAALAAAGVAFAAVPAGADTPTIQKLRVLSRNQQLIRLDFEESFSVVGRFDREAFVAAFAARLGQHAGVGAVVLSDYGKGTLADGPRLIAHARERQVPVLIDPKGTDWERYRGATLLTPNLAEFEAVVGRVGDDATLVARAEALREALDLTALLVTRSERGMTLVRAGARALHLPTHAREVYDVTGAGDTVIGTLAAGLAAGVELADACRLANRAAGVVVGRLGTVAISHAELAAALHADALDALEGEVADDADARVLDEAALRHRCAAWQAAGERVVMTNGVFDLLHVGHVRYLEAARRLGNRLVVAVNTDSSVRRLGKGPERPVNACADRLRVLAGLRCVDAVVAFAEDTPQRLIADILPDVLVKGGDYRPEDIAGGAEVRAAGGRVEVLKFHDGYSTTAMLARGGRSGGAPA